MMTKDFDPISEFPCHSEEFGEGVFIVSMLLAVFLSNFPFQTLSSLLTILSKSRSLQIIMNIQLQNNY